MKISLISKNKIEDLYLNFLSTRQLSSQRKKQYLSVMNALIRYERYSNKGRMIYKRLEIKKVTKEDILRLKEYLEKENSFICHDKGSKYKRGNNTVNDILKKLRTFFKWAVQNNIVKASPFDSICIEENIYGTPYYLNKEELHRVLKADISHSRYLETQRDIFVFQCCTGCRYGDLATLTPGNIIDGSLEYIASKTKMVSARTITVPLNVSASGIVSKYLNNMKSSTLFPMVNLPRYNRAIRKILTICEINRIVTILDPKTRCERKTPINKVASSHLARRTFIGNIYNKVQDPNLICSMTGHCEGSKAFLRYRSVEDETKRKLVKFLDYPS